MTKITVYFREVSINYAIETNINSIGSKRQLAKDQNNKNICQRNTNGQQSTSKKDNRKAHSGKTKQLTV